MKAKFIQSTRENYARIYSEPGFRIIAHDCILDYANKLLSGLSMVEWLEGGIGGALKNLEVEEDK